MLPGCGARLNYKKNVTLDVGEVQRIYWDEPLVEKATVTIKSPGVSVNAFLVLQVNEDTAKKAIDENKTPKDLLTHKLKTEEATFEVSPNKKAFVMLLSGAGKKAEIAVTATGK